MSETRPGTATDLIALVGGTSGVCTSKQVAGSRALSGRMAGDRAVLVETYQVLGGVVGQLLGLISHALGWFGEKEEFSLKSYAARL